MTTPAPPSYAGYRFPAEIISFAVWHYFLSQTNCGPHKNFATEPSSLPADHAAHESLHRIKETKQRDEREHPGG